MLTVKDNVPEGAKLRCLRSMDYRFTEGKEYECLSGMVAGLFPDRPYVMVRDDSGKKVTAYASRFELVQV